MPFRLSMLTDPLPWVFLAAVFLGAAASRATRRTAHRRDPDRASTREVGALLRLAVARGPRRRGGGARAGQRTAAGARSRTARCGSPSRCCPWVALAGFALALLATRFRKAAASRSSVLALVAVVALGLFFQSVRAFTGETEIATVKALAVADGRMRLEVQTDGRPSEMVDLDGDQFAPMVEGASSSTTCGCSSARRAGTGSSASYRSRPCDWPRRPDPTMWALARPTGITEALWTWFEQNEDRIPGVKTVQTELTLKRARRARHLGGDDPERRRRGDRLALRLSGRRGAAGTRPCPRARRHHGRHEVLHDRAPRAGRRPTARRSCSAASMA